MKRGLWTVLAALVLAPLAGAQEPAPDGPSAPLPRRVEARADAELKKMGAFLAQLPHFALEAEETFDEIPDGQLRRQLTNVRRIAVERPNHLAADATGDTLNRASWYDGRTVTVLDKEHNVYATIEAPGTIDATFDMLTGRVRGRVAAGRPSLLRSLRRAHGGSDLRALPGHPPGGGRRLPPPRVLPGDDRVADLDRRGRRAPAPQAGDQLRAGARRAAVQRRHPALESGVQVPEGLFTFEAPEGAQKVDAQAMAARGDAAPRRRPEGER